MSRNKEYQRLLNSRAWKELRATKLRRQPLCEMCQREGFDTSAIDCHHIVPVESAHTLAEMEELCLSIDNLMSLCIPCHIKIHKEARSHTKEAHKQRQDERLRRWIERNSPPDDD